MVWFNSDRLRNRLVIPLFFISFAALWLIPSVFFFGTGNGDMVARVGSLLVALAIFWAVLGGGFLTSAKSIVSSMDKRERELNRLSANELQEILENKQELLDGLSGAELERRQGVLADIECHREFLELGGYSGAIDYLELTMRRVEVFSLIFGTLQWGFGDLLVNRLRICGAFTC